MTNIYNLLEMRITCGAWDWRIAPLSSRIDCNLTALKSGTIAVAKQHWSVIGRVTKNLSSRAPPCFGRHVELLVPAVFAVTALGPRGGLWPPFLWVIHKEDLCPSSGDINRLMMIRRWWAYLSLLQYFSQLLLIKCSSVRNSWYSFGDNAREVIKVSIKESFLPYLASFACERTEVEPGRGLAANFALLVHLKQKNDFTDRIFKTHVKLALLSDSSIFFCSTYLRSVVSFGWNSDS
jgi:hypothetical protein